MVRKAYSVVLVVALSLIGLAVGQTKYGLPVIDGKPHAVVTTILEKPYLVESTNAGAKGNDRYFGYIKDLLDAIAKDMTITYEIILVKDGKYGSQENGQWVGMVGEITRDEANIAAAALTITHEREKVIDFTTPYMQTGIVVGMSKKTNFGSETGSKATMAFFLSPLKYGVWIAVIIAFVVVGVILALYMHFNPYETKQEATKYDRFAINKSLWLMLSSLFLQGSTIRPAAISVRILVAFWWFFSLVFLVTYISGMVRSAATLNTKPRVSSVEELASSGINFGTVDKGSTYSFFRNSTTETYKKMFKNLQVAKTVTGGMNRALNESYAFIGEEPMIEYTTRRNPECDLVIVGRPVNSRGYGFAVAKNSQLRSRLDIALLRMQGEGKLHALNRKWFVSGESCKRFRVNDEQYIPASGGKMYGDTSVGLDEFGGALLVLIIGIIISLIAFIIEICIHKKKNSNKGKADENDAGEAEEMKLKTDEEAQA
ncbi:glutamate receptor ionotropic, kainate 2-like [Tubulanus polymorphus]|uniref:glutamate receptor ionotropic, kainate 2-like n=1 Tax=Tubulanus polymorphus TaxID=672921 RepID=UPI003DA38176